MQPPEQPSGPPTDPSYSGYPYGPPPQPRGTNGKAVAAMVVSLAGLVSCPLVGAIGIYLGYRAREEIRRTGEEGDGMAQAGIIVGWVGIGLTVLTLCGIGVFIALSAGAAGLST